MVRYLIYVRKILNVLDNTLKGMFFYLTFEIEFFKTVINNSTSFNTNYEQYFKLNTYLLL